MLSRLYFSKDLRQVTVEDIQNLIDKKEVENYTLDYTEIPRKTSYDELAKVISAFLNTRGGLVIFGVSEIKNKYPKEITWGSISKETLARNLYHKIVPWNEKIEIHFIEHMENENKRIFVIDVPKSKNPPHMGSEKYYIRNVWENRPMTHHQIKRFFNETHMMKIPLIEKVIGPLINDIDLLLNNLSHEYKHSLELYRNIKRHYQYLLLQVSDLDLLGDIDDFYKKIDSRNMMISIIKGNALKIIRNRVMLYFNLDEKEYEVESLDRILNISADAETIYASKSSYSPVLETALLFKESIKNNIEKIGSVSKVIRIKYLLRKEDEWVPIEEAYINDFWDSCIKDAQKNELFQNIWKSTDEIETWAYSLLDKLLDYL